MVTGLRWAAERGGSRGASSAPLPSHAFNWTRILRVGGAAAPCGKVQTPPSWGQLCLPSFQNLSKSTSTSPLSASVQGWFSPHAVSFPAPHVGRRPCECPPAASTPDLPCETCWTSPHWAGSFWPLYTRPHHDCHLMSSRAVARAGPATGDHPSHYLQSDNRQSEPGAGHGMVRQTDLSCARSWKGEADGP